MQVICPNKSNIVNNIIMIVIILLLYNVRDVKCGDCDSVGWSYCFQYGYGTCYEWNNGGYAGCNDPNGNIAQYQAGYIKDSRSCAYWN